MSRKEKIILGGQELEPGKKLRLSDLGLRIGDLIKSTTERVKTKPKYDLPDTEGEKK